MLWIQVVRGFFLDLAEVHGRRFWTLFSPLLSLYAFFPLHLNIHWKTLVVVRKPVSQTLIVKVNKNERSSPCRTKVKLQAGLLNLCSLVWSQGRCGSLDMMQKGIVDPHRWGHVNDMMSITLQRKLIGTISNITVCPPPFPMKLLSPLKLDSPFVSR